MRKIFFSILLIITVLEASAQEKELLYSHYSFNRLAVNPAFAGTTGMLTASLSHRSQWIGFEGAPSYNLFSVHAPVKDSRTGIGFLAFNESMGLRKQTAVYMNYAHRISFGRSTLSLGLKAGFSTGSFDQSESENDDHVFNENALKFLLPNFGLGLFYYTKNFHAGISVPHILGYQAGADGDIMAYHDFTKYAYDFIAGYRFPLSPDFRIYPSVFIQYEKSSGIIGDYTLNVLYRDILSAGVSYRSTGAVIMLLNCSLNYQLKLGMAYDYGLSGINRYNRSSIEAVIEYSFGYRLKASNPTIF